MAERRTTKRATKKQTKARTKKKSTAKKRTTKKQSPAKRATKQRKAPASPGDKRMRVKQIRSGLGHARTYRRTLEALGLKHHQDVVTVNDTPSIRGMLHKVRHLVDVSEES